MVWIDWTGSEVLEAVLLVWWWGGGGRDADISNVVIQDGPNDPLPMWVLVQGVKRVGVGWGCLSKEIFVWLRLLQSGAKFCRFLDSNPETMKNRNVVEVLYNQKNMVDRINGGSPLVAHTFKLRKITTSYIVGWNLFWLLVGLSNLYRWILSLVYFSFSFRSILQVPLCIWTKPHCYTTFDYVTRRIVSM